MEKGDQAQVMVMRSERREGGGGGGNRNKEKIDKKRINRYQDELLIVSNSICRALLVTAIVESYSKKGIIIFLFTHATPGTPASIK